MHKQWLSPPVKMTDPELVRAWVQDMHTQLTDDGTGITHLAHIPGQFDFLTETISRSTTNIMIGVARSKPLYYKYESTGNNTLYIKVYFAYQSYTSHNINESRLITKSGVWTNEHDMINEQYYLRGGESTISSMKYSSSQDTYAGTVQFTGGDSFLINNDGTLFIAIHVGDIRDPNSSYPVTRPYFFLCVEALADGFNQIRHYNNAAVSNDIISSSSGSSSTSMQRTMVLTTVRDKQYAIEQYINYSNNVASMTPSLIQIRSYDHTSMPCSFSKMFFYNRSRIGGSGFEVIEGKTVFMAGSTMDENGFGHTNITFAILAD